MIGPLEEKQTGERKCEEIRMLRFDEAGGWKRGTVEIV